MFQSGDGFLFLEQLLLDLQRVGLVPVSPLLIHQTAHAVLHLTDLLADVKIILSDLVQQISENLLLLG